jgi:acyl-CoA dehydrogenase
VDFRPEEDSEAIRNPIRQLCARFDDSYWRSCDEQHRFRQEFYAAMAKGG